MANIQTTKQAEIRLNGEKASDKQIRSRAESQKHVSPEE
jgi:hypothetical protein